MSSKLWELLIEMKSPAYEWVDLSHPVNEDTPHYAGYNTLEMTEVFTYSEHTVCASEYKIVSQYGTHIDPPSHFVEGGRTLDQITLTETVMPLCVVDLTEKVANDVDYTITVDDLTNWEEKYGKFPENCFVAIRTDWSKRKGEAFFAPDETGQPHYPGWSLESLKFLSEERTITAVGHETPDTDPAIANLIIPWVNVISLSKTNIKSRCSATLIDYQLLVRLSPAAFRMSPMLLAIQLDASRFIKNKRRAADLSPRPLFVYFNIRSTIFGDIKVFSDNCSIVKPVACRRFIMTFISSPISMICLSGS